MRWPHLISLLGGMASACDSQPLSQPCEPACTVDRDCAPAGTCRAGLCWIEVRGGPDFGDVMQLQVTPDDCEAREACCHVDSDCGNPGDGVVCIVPCLCIWVPPDMSAPPVDG